MLHIDKSSGATLPAEQGVEHNKDQSSSKATTQNLNLRLKYTSQVILSTTIVDVLDVSGQ